jgi:2-hydroxy-3-keto-5-methylthiopentenyl-1-phosphate phosphatase
MQCRIICDFDGTIALEDVTDTLLERFALPEWQRIEDDWKAGRIGSRECMLRQVALLRATPGQIDQCLDEVAIDPGFPRFVATAAKLGCELLVVSDGLDYAIRRVLGRFGLDRLPILANRLELTGSDRWRLGFPHASDGCAKGSGTCKCNIATRNGGDARLRVLIGDGASDFCAATSVHMVFAKDRLLDHCRANALPHVGFTGFAEVGRLLADLLHTPAAMTPALELVRE